MSEAPELGQLPLTGERTVPDVAKENYWFRRHEAVYLQCDWMRGQVVLEAGSGEGYGANLLAELGNQVIAVDYDVQAIAHTRSKYSAVTAIRGNLAQLPIRSGAVDCVVNLQVIEHLWDQIGFLRECRRVLAAGGSLLVSTPNRLTFSPGRDTPLNPFHTREFAPDELHELMTQAGFEVPPLYGLYHGGRLRELDAKHPGGLIGVQTELALSGASWPDELLADVSRVTAADFEMRQGGPDDLAESLDLVYVGAKA